MATAPAPLPLPLPPMLPMGLLLGPGLSGLPPSFPLAMLPPPLPFSCLVPGCGLRFMDVGGWLAHHNAEHPDVAAPGQ